VLRLREVAERLNCSVANVHALRDAGLLRCVATGADGKGLRVEDVELKRFIADRRELRGRDANQFSANCDRTEKCPLPTED
jgi:predicted site-specific integrase-resolvase